MQKGHIDKILFWITIALLIFGYIIFFSASLGILARDGQSAFVHVILSQTFFGVVGGLIFMFILSKIPFKVWKKYSIFIFAFSLIATLLVFVPHLGISSGGGTRWLNLGPFTFQPSELLKLGFILFFATWASNAKGKVRTFKYGILPLGIILALTGLILLAQPDVDSFALIIAAALAIFIVSGAKWWHIGVIFLTGAVLAVALFFSFGYVHDRVEVFLNPGSHSSGAGYQVEQSLIAIGSGKFFGRGLGQSVQKFSYLPEPIGDSIFAVLGEELGFLGSAVLVGLFLAFAVRGFVIASRVKDVFGRLLAVGIVIIIVAPAFLNIASMTGMFPLAGLPLTFVSHGGSALLIALGLVGILLNVSKSAEKPSRRHKQTRSHSPEATY